MSLSTLIRKRESLAIATATPATFATHQAKVQPTVASVATVAVANPREDQSEPKPVHPRRTATQAEAEELRQLVAAIYAEDTEADRAEALDAALDDPGDALICYRAIALDRGTG